MNQEERDSEVRQPEPPLQVTASRGPEGMPEDVEPSPSGKKGRLLGVRGWLTSQSGKLLWARHQNFSEKIIRGSDREVASKVSDLPLSSVATQAKVNMVWHFNEKEKKRTLAGRKDVLGSYHFVPRSRLHMSARVRAAIESGSFADWLSILELVAAVLSMINYVRNTYHEDRAVDVPVQVLLAMFYVFHFVIKLFAAPVAWVYLISPDGVIDLLSMLPVFFVFMPHPRAKWIQIFRFIRGWRITGLLKRRGALGGSLNAQLFMLAIELIMLIITCSAVYQYVESVSGARQGQECGTSGCITFFTAFYAIVVTVSTVGYGDVVPNSSESRIVIICCIALALLIVPARLSKLIEIANKRPYGGKIAPTQALSHRLVILSGNMSFRTIIQCLANFFHPGHHSGPSPFPVKAVILAPYKPSYELKSMLGMYGNKVSFIEGISSFPRDLVRAGALVASSFFLLADKGADPMEEDAAQLERSQAVSTHTDSKTRIRVHLLSPTSLGEAIWGDAAEAVDLVCPEEIHMRLAARSCYIRGLSTLIVNLFTRGSFLTSPPPSHWLTEYNHSIQQLVVPILVPDTFVGLSFEEAAILTMDRFGVTLLALYTRLGQGKGASWHLLLAPITRTIHRGDIAFVIAPSCDAAEKITYDSGGASNGDGSNVPQERGGCLCRVCCLRKHAGSASDDTATNQAAAMEEGELKPDGHIMAREKERVPRGHDGQGRHPSSVEEELRGSASQPRMGDEQETGMSDRWKTRMGAKSETGMFGACALEGAGDREESTPAESEGGREGRRVPLIPTGRDCEGPIAMGGTLQSRRSQPGERKVRTQPGDRWKVKLKPEGGGKVPEGIVESNWSLTGTDALLDGLGGRGSGVVVAPEEMLRGGVSQREAARRPYEEAITRLKKQLVVALEVSREAERGAEEGGSRALSGDGGAGGNGGAEGLVDGDGARFETDKDDVGMDRGASDSPRASGEAGRRSPATASRRQGVDGGVPTAGGRQAQRGSSNGGPAESGGASGGPAESGSVPTGSGEQRGGVQREGGGSAAGSVRGKARGVGLEGVKVAGSDGTGEGLHLGRRGTKGKTWTAVEVLVEDLLAWPPVTSTGRPNSTVVHRNADKITADLASRTRTLIGPEVGPILLVCCERQPPSDFYYFLEQLRMSDAPSLPIVLLLGEEVTVQAWGEIGVFADVYVVHGSPLHELNLLRAGVMQAETVAVLAESGNDFSGLLEANREGGGQPGDPRRRVNDVHSSMVVANVLRLRGDTRPVSVFAELQQEASLLFVRPKLFIAPSQFEPTTFRSDPLSAVRFAQIYAAGSAFVPSFLDHLLFSSFNNCESVNLARQLVCGSPCEHLALALAHGTPIDDLPPSDVVSMLLVQIPAAPVYAGSKYEDVFHALLKDRQAIAVGLLRGKGTLKSRLPYVFTSPPLGTIVGPRDYIYIVEERRGF